MPPPKILVYMQPTRPPCRTLREYLSAKGADFEELDVTRDHQALEDLVEVHHSRMIPTLVIGDKVIIGFDRDQLEELL